jgi:probable rRNA maturation factor
MQADIELPSEVTTERLQSLVTFALHGERATGDWELNLRFATDSGIQDMHRQYMNLDTPTDIMTFPHEPDEFSPFGPACGGDIVISVETAAGHAEEAGWALADELLFLALHGVLHLLGWNDAEPDQRVAMLARQSDLLQQWRAYAGAGTA